MRRRFVSSKYTRQRGNFSLYDHAPTLEEMAAEKKRAEEAKALGLLQATTNTLTPPPSGVVASGGAKCTEQTHSP